MSERTYKVIELVGSSSVSTDEAIRTAIAKVEKTVRHINWFEVVETRGHVEAGVIKQFQVVLKIGFRLEE
jgi:flavin-binding protein dodecin